MAVTGTGAYTSSSRYLAGTYAATGAGTTGAATSTAAAAAGYAAATLVTLSAQAQAQLAAGTTADLETITADARAALDALYQAADVSGPITDGEPSVDLSSLDRRALYAIASNAGGAFTADEQAVAKQELQARFDAVLAPQAAVARLTGDWSRVYQAALDYLQGAGREEMASTGHAAQVAALQQGLSLSVAQDGALPSVEGDPVADFLARAGEDGVVDANLRAFSDVAKDARSALDLQARAAAEKGLELTYTGSRRNAQMVDLSEFDNRGLSAIALDEGGQFTSEEVRAAKKELDARTRATLLTAFQQAGAGSDPRSFSLGLLYSYQSMGTEERQAMNFTSGLRDLAVSSYQSTTSLISMLQQSTGVGTSFFG